LKDLWDDWKIRLFLIEKVWKSLLKGKL
jgi:hypothetical protein